MKNINKISFTFPTLLILLFSFLSNFILTYTNDYKLDYFTSSLFDFNNSNSVIMNIKKKDTESSNVVSSYNTLFNSYHYNLNVKEIRFLLDNSAKNNEDSIKLYTQSTFSISTTELDGGGYYVDNGIFASYYSDDILGNRGYLSRRFGCDSFIFISDNYADQLLKKYNIDSYEELITNEKFAVLSLEIDDNKTATFCINNILYSTKRHGVRAEELYNYFGLIYNVGPIMSWSKLSIDFDLKPNSYHTNKILKEINKLGYDSDNSIFTFYRSNKDTNVYNPSLASNEQFLNLFHSNDTKYIVLYWSCILASICSLFLIYHFLLRSKKYKLYSLGLILLCLLILSCVVSSLPYCYSFWSLSWILSFVSCIIICWKDLLNGVKYFLAKRSKEKSLLSMAEYNQVQI